MALPYFKEQGWEPVVLAVEPDCSENARDDTLLETIPDDVPVHRVRALPVKLSRRVGVGSLALRSLPYLRRKGNDLLSKERFDLVFFSSSLFPVMSLGPTWRKRHGVPYVLDFQDPWRSVDYIGKPHNPPGGKLKHSLSDLLGRILEPGVVANAAHMVVVSPAYPELLRERYPLLKDGFFTVVPFAAAESDFASAKTSTIQHDVFDPKDGRIHWVYAGVAGSILEKSLRAFFTALELKLREDHTLKDQLRIHFVGTEYVNGARARKQVEPMALEFGLAGIVDESTDRLPFLTTLKLLEDADALLIFGSADPSYTASKVFPYILARKPLLVIAHEKSTLGDIVRRTRAGTVISFDGNDPVGNLANRVYEGWFNQRSFRIDTDWKEFEKYSARSMTISLCKVFETATSASNV